MLKLTIIVTSLICILFGKVYATPNPNYAYNSGNKKAKIAIIIDDIGNKPADADAFALPEKVTFAILPHTEYSTAFSNWANQQSREVMLHMPMESLNGKALGEGALLSTMYPNQVEQALLHALESVPDAVGVNNHMGSKLTQITLQMSTVMDVLRDKGLFFVDSRTTRFTRAHLIAQQTGVLSAQRHIFLDHYAQEAFLQRQLDTLIRQARRKGKAIGIAHPYPVSIKFLNQALTRLPKDVELISMTEYLGHQKFRSIKPQYTHEQHDEAIMVSPD